MKYSLGDFVLFCLFLFCGLFCFVCFYFVGCFVFVLALAVLRFELRVSCLQGRYSYNLIQDPGHCVWFCFCFCSTGDKLRALRLLGKYSVT
jgi:hypothetical protein